MFFPITNLGSMCLRACQKVLFDIVCDHCQVSSHILQDWTEKRNVDVGDVNPYHHLVHICGTKKHLVVLAVYFSFAGLPGV